MKILPRLWGVQGLNEILGFAVWKLFAWDKSVCFGADLALPSPGGISYASVLPAADKETMMGEHEILCCS